MPIEFGGSEAAEIVGVIKSIDREDVIMPNQDEPRPVGWEDEWRPWELSVAVEIALQLAISGCPTCGACGQVVEAGEGAAVVYELCKCPPTFSGLQRQDDDVPF